MWYVKESILIVQFSLVQSLSRVRLFATPWIAARKASLSNTNSRSSLRLTSIESVMPSSHLILCSPLLLLPPIPPSIRVSSNESTLLTWAYILILYSNSNKYYLKTMTLWMYFLKLRVLYLEAKTTLWVGLRLELRKIFSFRRRRQKERPWKNTWGDNSWKLP